MYVKTDRAYTRNFHFFCAHSDTTFSYRGTLLSCQCLAAFLVELQVIVHRIPKRSLQFLDAHALERDDVAEVDYLAVEQPGLIVELDVPRITFVLQHALYPSADLTAKPLEVDQVWPIFPHAACFSQKIQAVVLV